jgi:nucleotide-binding universal stress UspA family protein
MRILIPVDGSRYSKSAVNFIASRTTLIRHQPAVDLLNVQHDVSLRVKRAAGKAAVESYQESEATKILKPCLAKLKRAGLVASAKFVVSTPGSAIGKRATDNAVDLIVMGSQGHTGFKSTLFGSVTHTVLASCTVPMLVLRDAVAPKKDSLQIGIALDGSKYGIAVVKFVVKHLALFGAKPSITLLHVAPDLLKLIVPSVFGAKLLPAFVPAQVATMQRAAFEQAMAIPKKLLKAAGLQVNEARLIGNNPGDEIAAYAKQAKLDVVVLGSHGSSALRSVTLGSVSTRVAAKCRNPLLLIRRA